MNNVFDLRRSALLFRNNFLQLWRGTAVIAAVIAGIILVQALLPALFGFDNSISYTRFYGVVLPIWGIIAASLAFTEMHDKTKNTDFLLLPASALEKTVLRLLWISVVLPLFIIIVITLSSLVIEGLMTLLFQHPFQAFNPFIREHWELMAQVIALQSVFFLGGAWFKKAHLVKTVLTMIVLSIIIVVIWAIFMRIRFPGHYTGFNIDLDYLAMTKRRGFLFFEQHWKVIVNILCYGLLAPFCWIVAWLRLKESQISDGI